MRETFFCRVMLCVLFFPLVLLVERRRNRCFFAILTLRIFEFAKNVLRNSLVLLSIIEGKSLSLSFSLIVAAFYLPPFANVFFSGGDSFGVRSG